MLLTGSSTFAQRGDSCEIMSRQFARLGQKTLSFYYGDFDSLNYYSNLFSSNFINYINQNPSTLRCKFDSLTQKHIGFGITTSANGKFRIYSWNTWLGGSMDKYNNLFQFESDGKIYTKQFDYGEEDMGTFYKKIYFLTVNNQHYCLAISVGSESSRYYYQMLSIFTIKDKELDDGAKIIKTSNGLTNCLTIEYDISNSISKWIKYDPEKKIIYVPKVVKGVTISNNFVRYKFTGKYFEKLQN